jgi:hypothetical protein
MSGSCRTAAERAISRRGDMNTGRASGTGVGTPRRTGISQRKDHSPRPTVRTPARDRAAVAGFSARKRSGAAAAVVLSLPDRAARYRACQAVEAIEKSDRGADGSSTPRARQRDCVAGEVPWPYESFRRRPTGLRRPALRERDRATSGLSCRVAPAMTQHLVGALK